MYPHLSTEVWEQLEEETREIAGESFYDLQSHVTLYDSYLINLEAQIDKLDPFNQAASTWRAKRERLIQAKDCLVLIQNGTERSLFSSCLLVLDAYSDPNENSLC